MIKTRIFVACADVRLRIAMLLLLDQEPGMIVVGITDRLGGLLTQLAATQPDALLFEWDLPFQSIADLLTGIHKLECPPKVIFLSSKPEEEEKIREAGSDYFITKNAPPDELLPTLNNIGHVKHEFPANDI